MHIQKHNIIDGCYYVVIEEINLRLLCACPPNVFKFLKKQGFINKVTSQGVSYEGGPNAILLSDLAIQNNSFSNLIEFPALQMLYKQGMMIPNHPGNTGKKPLIIGSTRQISAMVGYIYTGNYGLDSIEEMANSGLSEDEAREIMRMKLKFAFGRFRSPDELFDYATLTTQPVNIAQDLHISRIKLNVFLLEYKGESCEIDLNLGKNVTYPSPYPEVFFNIPREHFAILHTGDGDGWNADLPAMSSVVMHNGKIYLIDAEPNIGHVLFNLGISVNEVVGIFNTHAHDDHIGGMASFMKNNTKVKYYSTSFVKATMLKKLAALTGITGEDLSRYCQFVNLELDEWNDIDGLQVKPTLSIHPVENVNFLFSAPDGDQYKYYSHLADTASFDVMDSMLEPDIMKPGISQKLYDQTKANYLKKVNLKKIDIGGGMIHGSSKDFITDESDRILLSHMSGAITKKEATIGDVATLGSIDILIKDGTNYLRKIARELLQAYFTTPSLQIDMLLDAPIVTLPPQSILIEPNIVAEHLYLILSGSVSDLDEQHQIIQYFAYGSLIGNAPYFLSQEHTVTYRCETFVHALKIPMPLFDKFIRQNDLHVSLHHNFKKQAFLQRVPLFFNALSGRVKNDLSEAMHSMVVERGETLPSEIANNYLCIIDSGKVQIVFCHHILYELGNNDFIRPAVFFKHNYTATDIVFAQKTTLHIIPLSLIRVIPSIVEKIDRRLAEDDTSLIYFQEKVFIEWDNPHIYHLRDNNNQHDQIVHFANIVYMLCRNGAPRPKMLGSFNYFSDLCKKHFDFEETLMIVRNKKLFREQRKNNKEFLRILQKQIQDFKDTGNTTPLLIHIQHFINRHLKDTSHIESNTDTGAK